jgi:hypothetical protein
MIAVYMQVMLWSLDPYAGELTGEKLAFEGRGAMQRLVVVLSILTSTMLCSRGGIAL